MFTMANENWSGDPLNHFMAFKCRIDLHIYNNEIKCKAFLMTFEDKANLWYKTLKPKIINTIIEFSRLFMTHFYAKRRVSKTIAHLMIVK